ncbi:MAG TPA: hypothetical protein VN317_10180 [Candidatus Methanoperedens sp.]|nr:hypothetical protein [Candidatus Methanoperedens sp.]
MDWLRDLLKKNGLQWLIAVMLLVNALGFVLRPIGDPDLFWHLRTGDWIREHHALPQELIGAAAPSHAPPGADRFSMTSYWLADLLLSLLYGAGGLGALVALRAALLGLLLFLVYRRARGDGLVRAGMLLLAVNTLGQYPAERPQFLSFVFAAALLLLLDGIREAPSAAAARWRGVAVPPLMALWANCHAGFLIGLGFLGVYAVGELTKRLTPRLQPLPPERLRLLLAAAAGGFLASLLNPNGWLIMRFARVSPVLTGFVSEYFSTIEFFSYNPSPWIVVYWMLLAVAVTGFAFSRRLPDPAALALVLLTGYFSFTQLRHVPYFVVVAVPVAVASLSGPRLVRVARAAVAAAGLCAGAYFLPGAVRMIEDGGRGVEVNDYLFPVDAAAFIESQALQGSMFNQHGWGGYLLWRLAPRQVFIDGRNADPDLVGTYIRVLAGDRSRTHDKEYWKDCLERHDIRYTVTGFYDPQSGQFQGLIDALLEDPEWIPVFSSSTALVFAENVPQNSLVIRRNALPKAGCYPALLNYADRLIAAMPTFVPPYVAKGELHLRLGDRAAALAAYAAALRLAPDHAVARARVASLRAGV